MAKDRVQIDVKRRRIIAPHGAEMDEIAKWGEEALERQSKPLSDDTWFEAQRTDHTNGFKYEDIFRHYNDGTIGFWSPWVVVFGPPPS